VCRDEPCHETILLLEDLPEIRAWLRKLVLQVFPRRHHLRKLARARRARAGAAAKFDLALSTWACPTAAAWTW
jgi:hypothetical protein